MANTSTPNQTVVQRVYQEIWSQGRADAAESLFTATYKNHDPATPGRTLDRAGFLGLVAMFRASIPDLAFTITEQVAAGDRVTTHWCATGTHTGAPLFGAPATGRPARVEGLTLSRFAEGRIDEDLVVWDTLGLLRQLGLAA